MNKNISETGSIYGVPILAVIGAILIVVGLAGPAALATIKVDTTGPDLVAVDPCGSKSNPNHWDPNTTRTLEVKSLDEKAHNPTVTLPDGTTHSMSFEREINNNYYYKYEGYQTGEESNAKKFVFKAEDSSGNSSQVSAWAEVGGYADGYFTINGKKVSKGETITINTRKITLKGVVTTDKKADSAKVIIRTVDVEGYNGKILKIMEQTSPPYEFSYTFPKDGTYKVEGFFKSYDKYMMALSLVTGVNEKPNIPLGMQTWQYVSMALGGVLVVAGFITRT